MREKFKQVITDRLVELGWTKDDGGAIATKSFDTAVGPKVAAAYLSIGGQVCLSGDYTSEGRNALAQCLRLFPLSTELTAVETIVGQFAAEADTMVADTYAARLLRQRT